MRAECSRKLMSLVALCLCSCAHSWVSQAYLGPYIARDSMRWRIPDTWQAGLSIPDINVLSELSWKPLVNAGVQAGFEYSLLHPQILFRGDGQLGAILAGHVRDSDWHAPNFALEVSRSMSSSRGWTAIGQLMAGVKVPGQMVAWAPSIGVDGAVISLHQHGLDQLFQLNYDKLRLLADPSGCLKLLEGDVIAEICPNWCEEGKVSAYHVKWAGPLAALTLWLAPANSLSCELHGWYSLGRYSAEADWCLQDMYRHPRSFLHHARIHTWQAQLSVMWQLVKSLGLVLQVGARHTWSGEGEELVYLADGHSSCGVFEDLSWKRFWATLAIGFGF
jgi:hypothetical protein